MYFEFYENFVTCIDCGTISAASKKLHIAQPALSNQIKALEERYGAQLVIRGPRSLTLTESGKVLYDNAKKMCQLESATEMDIKSQCMGYQGKLLIGSIGNQPEKASSDLLIKFHEQNPNISYRIYEGSSKDIRSLLQDGTVEVGFFRCTDELPSNFSVIYSVPCRYSVFFSDINSSFTGSKAPISLRELMNCPISIAGGIYQSFVDICEEEGFSPNIVSVCASIAMTRIWARTSDAVAIYSMPLSEFQYTENCRMLEHERLRTTHYICYNKEKAVSPALKKFIKYCKEELS